MSAQSVLRNVWLRPAPDARPDRQVLFGDPVEAGAEQDGWVEVTASKDGYRGVVPESALGAATSPTHWVSARSTWGYSEPDLKSPIRVDLHMTGRLEIVAAREGWLEARFGGETMHVPAQHCREWNDRERDPIKAARMFLGTPYLWAGNTGFGLDCSGLVQLVYHACGWACAADSGDQADMPGEGAETMEPGDLIFWKGHVALETGEGTILHANAHHMAVVEEPRHAASQRIAATETGPVIARLRPEKRALV